MHRLLTALVLSAVGTPALALPSSIVDLGGSVLDRNTNFEWLALNVPAHCSLDDINNGTPGCTFLNEGWTLASEEQVVTFLQNAGVGMGGTTPPDQDAIDLINALGPTNAVVDGADPDFLVTEIWGITSTPGGNDFRAPFVSLFESRSGDAANFVFVGTADVRPAYVPSGPGDVVISYWFFRHKRGCEVQVNQSTYVNGDTVTVTVFRLTNSDPTTVNVELKFWLDADAFAPISLANVPTLPLPAGFDQNLGPFPLFLVTAPFPRGGYELGCRLLDPVTGKTRAESIASFVIQ